MDAFSLKLRSMARMLSATLPAVAILIFCTANANGYYDNKKLNTGAYNAVELEAIIGEYQTQANVLNKQIQDTQKDLDWLVLKINRISDSGRKAPRALKSSVVSKEKKLARLKNEKERLDEIIAGYESAFQATMKKAGTKKTTAMSAPIKSTPIPVKVPDVSMAQGKISDIEMAVKKAGLEDWVEVLNADGGCAKINNTLPILFSSGSAALAKEYKRFLKKLARFLKPYDVKIYVNGFADPDPINTKRYPSNFELGASRAANIVHEMVRYGLKPAIFKIGTTGEYRFAAKVPSQNKSFQRRAQVTVVFSS
ncbi:MAG: OmpA family protein [Desulfobacter sp.]|nr:MAG: OmpA family protein [Desulfobacter sp.]